MFVCFYVGARGSPCFVSCVLARVCVCGGGGAYTYLVLCVGGVI